MDFAKGRAHHTDHGRPTTAQHNVEFVNVDGLFFSLRTCH